MNTGRPRIPVTVFAEIDGAMLGVVRAYRTLQNDKFSRGELAAWKGLEQAAKRLQEAFQEAKDRENGKLER